MKKQLLFAILLTNFLLTGLAANAGPASLNKSGPVDESGRSAAAWVKAGNAFMQDARESADASLFDAAQSVFERALALEPKNADALVGMAWVSNSRHQFGEGMSWAKKAIEAGAKDHMPYSLLGDAAVELGKYDEAFEYYQAGMDRSPNLSTYSRSAHLLWLTGDAVKARLLMQRAIDAGGPHPENAAWCRAELALMLFNAGALLPAEQQVELALQKAPENYHALYVAGKVKTAKKHYDQAQEKLMKSLARNSGHGNHDAMVALGDLYSLVGKKEEAEKIYAQIIAMHTSAHSHRSDGANPHLHQSGGNAQLARFYADHDRNLDLALQEARQAYEVYPNVFVTTTLAWCNYKNGRYQDARKMINKALAFGTQDAAIYFRAGMIAARMDDRVNAQKQLSKALSLNPNFHPIEARVTVETLNALSARHASSVALQP